MSTDTLDLPTITDPAPEVAPAGGVPATIDLKKVDLQAVALAQFGDWRTDVADARKNLSTLVLDLSIPARIAEAKSLRQRLVNAPIADARATSKALKSRLAAVSKAVGAEEEAAVAAYTAAGTLITPKIEAAEQAIEDARIARERAEEDRIHGLKLAVDAKLDPWADRCNEDGMTAERVQKGMDALAELPMPPECKDVAAYWAERLSITRRGMESRRLALAAAELEAQQAKVRAEQQRVAGIQARIAEIQAAATGHEKASSADLAEAILAVDALAITADLYAEFLPLAQAARSMTLLALDGLQVAAVARETAEAQARAEAQRLADEREKQAMAEAAAAERQAQIQRDLARPLPLTIPEKPEFTEGQEGQQVLKAEPATADATDRADPADASPRVGAMGAGQAADAAPAGDDVCHRVVCDDRCAYPACMGPAPAPACEARHADDDGSLETSEADARPYVAPAAAPAPAPATDPRDEFVALVMGAFDCRFPSHPKPSQDWWAKVRAAGQALQA